MGKQYEEIKNDMVIWTPKLKDDQIEGKVLDIKDGDYGKQWKIDDEIKGMIWTPSHKLLQGRMSNIGKNDEVKIVFEGVEPPKKRGQNGLCKYSVFKAK